MDESARERDIYYRAARIIAYKSRGVRRPPPTIFPILGPISPPLSLSIHAAMVSPGYVRRESPSPPPPPPLSTTQQTTATSRQLPLKILIRTHVRTHTRIGTRCRGCLTVFSVRKEKKNLFFREKKREKRRRRESLDAAQFCFALRVHGNESEEGDFVEKGDGGRVRKREKRSEREMATEGGRHD